MTSRTISRSGFMSSPARRCFITFTAFSIPLRLQKICGEKTASSFVLAILDQLHIKHWSWDAIYTRAESKDEWNRLVVGRPWWVGFCNSANILMLMSTFLPRLRNGRSERTASCCLISMCQFGVSVCNVICGCWYTSVVLAWFHQLVPVLCIGWS